MVQGLGFKVYTFLSKKEETTTCPITNLHPKLRNGTISGGGWWIVCAFLGGGGGVTVRGNDFKKSSGSHSSEYRRPQTDYSSLGLWVS